MQSRTFFFPWIYVSLPYTPESSAQILEGPTPDVNPLDKNVIDSYKIVTICDDVA